MRAGIDIKTVFDVGDRHTRRLGVDQGSIGTSRQQARARSSRKDPPRTDQRIQPDVKRPQ